MRNYFIFENNSRSGHYDTHYSYDASGRKLRAEYHTPVVAAVQSLSFQF